MHKDLVIIPEDHPGVLASIGEAMGEAGINIHGISAFTGGGKGVVHLLVNRPEEAHRVLVDLGFEVKAVRDVVVADVEDRPGQLGRVCRQVADAGINVEQAYIAGDTRLVLIVDDTARAREILGITAPPWWLPTRRLRPARHAGGIRRAPRDVQGVSRGRRGNRTPVSAGPPSA